MTASDERAAKTYRREIASGAAWMLAFKLTERLLGLLSTVILARLLLPSDFGIVAMAMSAIAILELLSSFSFDVALIQRPSIDRRHLDTAWTFNLIFGVALCLLMAILAPAAASYYRDMRLEHVLYVLAFGWLVQGFENIGTVAFRRELQFDREYRFLTAKKLFATLITVPLAFWLESYWALIIGMVAAKFFAVFMSYRMHPYRPRFSLVASRDLLTFSSWLAVNNALYFLNQRSTDLIVGRMAGAQALGLYSVAFEFANMPTTEIAAPINRAMLAGYAKLAAQQGELGKTYLETVGAMAMFTLPAGLGIAAVADPLVKVILGTNWLDTIPLMKILGLYGAIASIGTNTASALLALGQPRMLTALAAARVILLVPVLAVALSQFGLIGAAWAALVVTVVMTPINFLVLLPRLGVGIRSFMEYLWRPLFASTLMYAMVTQLGDISRHSGFSSAGILVAQVAAGAACYALLICLLWILVGRPNGIERTLLDIAQTRAPWLVGARPR